MAGFARVLRLGMLLLLLGSVDLRAFETLEVVDTAYIFPPDALFVASDGLDTNPGTEAAPLRTVAHAVDRAGSGGTIVIRQGTYREGDIWITRGLTLQPYPHETVWLKGSLEVTGWTADGAHWRHDGWTWEFAPDTYDPGAFEPAYPYAGLPDMVFFDGEPLAQVGSEAELGPGRFYVDYAADRLFVGDDPTGRSVEAAAFEQALVAITTDGSVIRGLGFQHYAGHRFQGALQCDGAVASFENNTVAWGASKGLTVYNGGAEVRGNTFIYNGQMGMGAWRTDGLLVEANRFAANNQEHFVMHGAVAEAAGAKLTVASRLVVRDNLFEDNLSQGLWLDVSDYDVTIVGNTARGNSSIGIFFEISHLALVAGNLLVDNVDAGLSLSNASSVEVWNNTLVRNGSNLVVVDDSRVNGDPDELQLGITWITSDITIHNNLLANGHAQGSDSLLFARDYNSTPLKDADEMLAACDRNGYHRTDASLPSSLVEWWRGTQHHDYPDLAAFTADTGFEPTGQAFDDVTPSPYFVDEAGGDFQLVASSPARDAGLPLPQHVADALGLPAGEPVDLGAFQYQGGAPPPPPVPGALDSVRPVRVTKAGAGLVVSWDTRCDAGATHIIHGPLGSMAAYDVSGAVCAIADPQAWDTPPAEDLWFLLVSDNGEGVEGSWGLGPAGERNGSTPSGTCGNLSKDPSGPCD